MAAAHLHVRIGSVFSGGDTRSRVVVANQEREKLHLDNPVVHDTEAAISVAAEALKNLIEKQ